VKSLESFKSKERRKILLNMDSIDRFSDLEPISHRDFKQIINIFLANAFLKNQSKLISKISSCVPNYLEIFSVPHRQTLIFLSFYRKWREIGPLPDLRHYKFLLTLHDGVLGILKSHREIVKQMPRPDLIKLVTGLRTLLGKAVMLEEKFVIKDVETFIMKYLPVLPVTGHNRAYWLSLMEPLDIDLGNKEGVEMVSGVNTITTNHLNRGLLNLAKERDRNAADLDASFLSIFDTIEPKLSAFIKLLEDLITQSYPPNMTVDLNPQTKAVLELINLKAEEEDLIKSFETIMNFNTESSFWTSDLISQRFEP